MIQQRFGVEYRARHLAQLLQKLGFSYQKERFIPPDDFGALSDQAFYFVSQPGWTGEAGRHHP